MGQKASPNWAIYSNEELLEGAKRHGLTVDQERQRMRIVQSGVGEWPTSLRKFIAEQERKHCVGLEFVGFTVYQRIIIEWLKQGNSVSVSESVSMKEELALAAV